VGNHVGVQIPPSAPVFSQCRPWGFERARNAERLARKSATHESAKVPSPAAKAVALDGRRLKRSNPPFSQNTDLNGLGPPTNRSPARGSRNPRPLGSPASRIGRGDERDALEPRYDRMRWWGTSNASLRGTRQAGAPLPYEIRSLGYPATETARGKAQAGKSPLPQTQKFRRRVLPTFTCCPRWSSGCASRCGSRRFPMSPPACRRPYQPSFTNLTMARAISEDRARFSR
jgi:hypothetical protein